MVSDLLAKPFSMGKNLLCVISKKHMVSPHENNVASIQMRVG